MKQHGTPDEENNNQSTATPQNNTPRINKAESVNIPDLSAIYHTLFDIAPEGIMILDAQTGQVVDINTGLTQMLNCPREEFVGRTFTDVLSTEDVSAFHQAICNLQTQKHIFHPQVPLKTKDGKDLRVSFDCYLFASGGRDYVKCVIRELEYPSETVKVMEDFRTAEDNNVKSDMKYRTIVENSQEGIFQASPQSPHPTVNYAFATMLGYESTHEAQKCINNISEQIYADANEYRKVMDIVLREGGIKGYETQFYRRDKSRIWVNMSVSAVRDMAGQLLYYHSIVEDITLKKKLEEERQDSINRLRRSLGATINAMSATVEARDPYTAGHQRRVADLARAIATEMNLSRDQIDGIRLAGMIHDIGKISVPSEILTKPTRLTTLEFELIKTHSEAGFNILKDIEFPWPIARIVMEHHERVNGTGYPQGLKGEDILLESKIIAVADIVEAISSNRPYRPAFGITPALDEVAKNSGVLYDKDAAEACLKLFRENRYKMPF